MVTADEFDNLLEGKFGLRRDNLIAALYTMPTIRPGTAALPGHEARLLDAVGFVEDSRAYVNACAVALVTTAMLIDSASAAEKVASALSVSESWLLQRLQERSFWTIDVDGRSLFPAMQFEDDLRTGSRQQIRGLDQIFRALPDDLHPVSVAGFLCAPHPLLVLEGRSVSPIFWLRSGADIAPVSDLVAAANWIS
jgi:hypothetical protein